MTILPVHRICPRCQASNAAEATICRVCGTNINDRLAVAAAAVALRIGRRLVAAWWAKRRAPAASGSEVIPVSDQRLSGFKVTRKTWWHISSSDGSSQWGSQQDTWDIEPH